MYLRFSGDYTGSLHRWPFVSRLFVNHEILHRVSCFAFVSSVNRGIHFLFTLFAAIKKAGTLGAVLSCVFVFLIFPFVDLFVPRMLEASGWEI